MSPQMIETLYQISLLFAPEPETVFQQIVETVARMYGGTMAMINLIDGDCLRFRAVVNRHPLFRGMNSLNKKASLCQFSIGEMRPLLIQNAREHPEFCRHVVVKLKLRRYLGVPICRTDGSTIGTLCFLDDNVENLLGEEDIQFLSFLAMRVSAELERERLIEERLAEQRAYAQQLQATAQEKRAFVSMVIHDLRHPLTSLQTGLYLLGVEQDASERAAQVTMLEGRVKALRTLLDELVEYDQIEAGRPALRVESVDLRRFIPTCIQEVTGFNGKETVPVCCEIAPDLGVVETDPRKLRHILLNLVTNALKFTEYGRVVVRICPESETHWSMEVQDTGSGMSPSIQERAFDEYFSSTENGVGLGLAIAQRLWTVLGAQVTLDSRPEQGTRFRLVFPHTLVEGVKGAEKRTI